MFIGPSLCKTVDNYVETLDNSTLSGHFRFTERNILYYDYVLLYYCLKKGPLRAAGGPPIHIVSTFGLRVTCRRRNR